jgi:PKD repeat protein
MRAILVSLVALGSLIAVSTANAAAWQGPWQVSAAGVNAGDSTHGPQISLGASGDATAAWYDPTGVIVARKPAGQPWSAPLAIGNPVTASIYPGVDGGGNTTTAWSNATPQAIVSYWPAGAPSATSQPLPGALTVNDLQVNAAGAAVLAATSGADVVVGYRAAGAAPWSFALHTFTTAGLTYVKPRVAINAAGMAVVIFRDTATGLWASTRTATSDWGAIETVTTKAVFDTADANPSVAIDGAGNIFAAFAYTLAAGNTVVRTALRPPSGGWQESPDLSTGTAPFQANYVSVAVNPSGQALLVWEQFMGATNIQARYGSTGTGIWGPVETVNDAGADVPVAAIGNDGTGVAAWERQTMSGNTGQARVRSPGPNGTWSDIHLLSDQHANYTKPSISTDGRGDFAVISAPFDGSAQRALVSAYDASPPTVTTPSVTGTLLAGDPLVLSVNATDEWSAVGTPTWTFGDGGAGTGLTPVHTYAAAGSYTAHVTVTDASGNSAGKDVLITIASPQSTLTSAKFTGKWKLSRVAGALTVAGAAPRAGSYAIDVLKGTSRKIHSVSTLTAGAFTKTIKLPAKFLPGTYTVSLIPADTQVKGASLMASLAAPVSGVVDTGFLSGARSGTAARTLTGATTIWANFHFAAKPKGDVTLTWFKLGKKRVRIGATSKPSAVKIVSFLRVGGTFVGTYQAVLSRKGVVIATASVKAKKG